MSPIGKPMPNIALTDLSGKPVKLDTFQSELILLNIFSINADTCRTEVARTSRGTA